MAAQRVNDVQLISADRFKALVKAGAKAEDVGHLAVFKASAEIKAIANESRTIEFILSTPSVDREGDTIAVEGWQLQHYLMNPVVQFAHLHQELPIAKSVATWIEGQKLRARDQFATAEDYDFADTVYRLLCGGFLNATSVGFNPMEWQPARERQNGIDFLKQELLEHSIVPIPAHPDALIQARSKGINTNPMRSWTEKALDLMSAGQADPRLSILLRLREQSDPTGMKFFAALGEVKMPVKDPGDETDDIDVDGDPIEEPAANPAEVPATDPPAEPPPAVPAAPSEVPEADGGTDPGKRLTALLARRAASEVEHGALAIAPAPEAPLRWNARLGKAFDVARTVFEARSVEEGLVAKFLGVDLKHIERHTNQIVSVRMGAALSAIDAVIRGQGLGDDRAWAIVDTRNINEEGQEEPVLYESIQLNSKLTDSFLVDGMRFMQRAGISDDAPEERVTLRVTPTWWGCVLTAYGVHEQGSAIKLLNAIADKASTFKFLKGEAFALSGDFIPKTTETTDDLFLDPKNAKAVNRIVELINTRGAKLENRGAILLGPPGTGKTLAGRIIRNSAEATFIWMSARDFAYGGGFNGLCEAFDLGRELAPTVLFIEDVDNWLNGYTTDLMKTEMDGIARSTGMVTILTTNFPELLPAALMDRPGRFHDILRFDLPNVEARALMLAKWMPDATAEARAAAVTATEGYSGAHLRELARFASIIRDQDGVSADDAVLVALEKLKEQRALINDVQSHGSRYRAPAAVVTRSVSKAKRVELVAEVRVLDMPEVQAAIEAMRVELDSALKAGRVLSRANETKLQHALDAIDAVIGKLAEAEDVSASTVTQLQKAATAIRELLAQLATAPDDPAAAAAEPEVKAGHILMLDDEVVDSDDEEELDIDASLVREVLREELMLHTGRVDFE